MKARVFKIIYYYLMCFFCVMFILFKGTALTTNIIAILNADVAHPRNHMSNDELVHKLRDNLGDVLPAEEIEELRQQEANDLQTDVDKINKRELIETLSEIIFAGLVLAIYLLLIKREKEQ
jgi:hypothetical protein